MVSIRCKMLVKEELAKLGIGFTAVNLGEAELAEDITTEQRELLKIALLRSELVLIEDEKAMLINKIKSLIVEMIHYADELPATSISVYLSKKINCRYAYLAKLFSETQAITIERFILHHKIERIKELLIYEQLPLREIAWKLNYSSVGYLSSQFKKVTGLTPTHFRTLRNGSQDLIKTA